jgi:small-conductance mechanosensitive channel
MPAWERAAIAGGVVLVALIVAKTIDMRLARRSLGPGAATRYRVLRRTISVAIVTVGIFSALLTIPGIRVVAGGILASSAVVGLVVGFAAQRTLSNLIAGVLIAITQPLRLGDLVTVGEDQGVVEEIGLTYTFIRLPDGARLVIPNEKLASDTIRNSTIRTRETVAEVTLQVPLTHDLDTLVGALEQELSDSPDAEARVSALDGEATIVLRVPTQDDRVDELEHELRLRAHRRLRVEGVYA